MIQLATLRQLFQREDAVGKSTVDVADAELSLLQVLWERGATGARDITEAIYGDATPSHVATVQKLLQRLEAKSLVVRDRSQHVHQFRATVTRTHFAGSQLEKMADKLTEGSLVPFLTHMAQSKKLSKGQRDQLRKLLDEDKNRQGNK